jgi:hypothetical protein
VQDKKKKRKMLFNCMKTMCLAFAVAMVFFYGARYIVNNTDPEDNLGPSPGHEEESDRHNDDKDDV